MYTLEELRQKSLKELKEIGYQLDRLPQGDRRCRQNWIDVIADVQPPLLQLLEVSPAVEVESVQEAIEVQLNEPLAEYSPSPIECPNCGFTHGLFTALNSLNKTVIRCRHCTYSTPKNYLGAIKPLVQESAIGFRSHRALTPLARLQRPTTAVLPKLQSETNKLKSDRPKL